jgi:transcriptional regulator with XRE-family HTH domain
MMGNRLKKILNREKVTAYQIWKDLGIDQGQLSRFLNEKEGISLDKLEKISDYLGYDIKFVKRQTHSQEGAKR